MDVVNNHLMTIFPWGPHDGEEGGGAITTAAAAAFGPYDVGEVQRFSSAVDFHYVMSPDATTAVATTSHQVHRYNWAPLELTIEPGFTYISVICATSNGTLISAPIHPALNKKDSE